MTRFRTRRPVRRGPTIELDDHDASRVEDRRRSVIALVGTGTRTARRVEAAPAGYLLTQGPADVARHCHLLELRPAPGKVRVAVTPAATGWHVDLASRDRPGLLASVTGVLSAHELDVTQAVVATWADGDVLEAFIVTSSVAPDPTRLHDDVETSLGEVLTAPPVTDADVAFDNQVSPWYTRCDVHAADRPGLFHALAVALATSGADVHAARATTVDGSAHDRFDLTDQLGNKLTAGVQELVRHRLHAGAPRRLGV